MKKNISTVKKSPAKKRDRSQVITVDLGAGPSPQRRKQARQVIDLFVADIPDFITDAVMNALQEAAALKHVNIWNPAGDELDPQGVAELFGRTGGTFSLDKPARSERATLAHAISTILKSEETPVPLYNRIGDFVTDICSPLLDDSPETIERALALEAEPVMRKWRAASHEAN